MGKEGRGVRLRLWDIGKFQSLPLELMAHSVKQRVVIKSTMLATAVVELPKVEKRDSAECGSTME